MNETTQALIRELAEKLGTTVDHLWEVMVRQAPITGVIDIAVNIGWILSLTWAFKFISSKTKASEWVEEGAFLAWLIWGVAAIIVFIITGATIESSISAILNPEYWALKKLLP